MAIGEICNFAAYLFVEAILVTPLGALVSQALDGGSMGPILTLNSLSLLPPFCHRFSSRNVYRL